MPLSNLMMTAMLMTLYEVLTEPI
jgi:hypothetical protein